MAYVTSHRIPHICSAILINDSIAFPSRTASRDIPSELFLYEISLYYCIIFKLMFPVSFILDICLLHFLLASSILNNISNLQAPFYFLPNLSKAELKTCVCITLCMFYIHIKFSQMSSVPKKW